MRPDELLIRRPRHAEMRRAHCSSCVSMHHPVSASEIAAFAECRFKLSARPVGVQRHRIPCFAFGLCPLAAGAAAGGGGALVGARSSLCFRPCSVRSIVLFLHAAYPILTVRIFPQPKFFLAKPSRQDTPHRRGGGSCRPSGDLPPRWRPWMPTSPTPAIYSRLLTITDPLISCFPPPLANPEPRVVACLLPLAAAAHEDAAAAAAGWPVPPPPPCAPLLLSKLPQGPQATAASVAILLPMFADPGTLVNCCCGI